MEKNRLDAQIGEMEQIYKTECQTTQYLTESLEREVESRLQLEAELRALKQKLQQRRGGFWFLKKAIGFYDCTNF